MGREIRRVPVDWQHPTTPNPYWREQQARRIMRGDPESRLHGPDVMFKGLFEDYPEALERWEREATELAQRTGSSWEHAIQWHLTGYDNCQCHPGETGVTHPCYVFEDPNEEAIPVEVRDEDHLHELEMAEKATEKPDPADYVPVWDVPADDLGWCLYETVTEGTPITPTFATAEELVEHLSTQGDDWKQQPWRREAAEAMVQSGWAPSFITSPTVGVLQGGVDSDRIAAAFGKATS